MSHAQREHAKQDSDNVLGWKNTLALAALRVSMAPGKHNQRDILS